MAEVGKYTKAKKRGYKVAGLSASQMEKATTLKGKKLTAGQKTKASKLTEISKTKWVEGKGVIGPKGKSFTGSVILPNGKTASYVNGRRVGVNTKKKAAAPSSSRTTLKPNPKPKPKTKVTRVPPSVRGEGGGGSLSTYQANRLGAEGPKYSVARATKPSYGPYESQSDRNKKSARKAAAAAAAKRNQSKPRSNGKAVPMQLRKQKDGSYRWVKVV